jgi:hypothetical protein
MSECLKKWYFYFLASEKKNVVLSDCYMLWRPVILPIAQHWKYLRENVIEIYKTHRIEEYIWNEQNKPSKVFIIKDYQ